MNEDIGYGTCCNCGTTCTEVRGTVEPVCVADCFYVEDVQR